MPERAKTSGYIGLAALIGCTLTLAGCGWVDSTGGDRSNSLPSVSLTSDGSSLAPEDTTEPGVPGNVEDLPQDDAPPSTSAMASSLGPLRLDVNEEATVALSAVAEDADGLVQSLSWEEQPSAEGALEACAGVEGFNSERAAPTLAEACSEPDCSPAFDTVTAEGLEDELADDGQAPSAGSVPNAALTSDFEIRMPALQAPVGLTYELIATDDLGGIVATPLTLCLVAINEAPEAADDSFSVLEGSVLEVSSTSLNLLSNDTDDIDTSNEPLSVLPEPASGPLAADVFELGIDGGFTYAYTGASLSRDIEDSFDYSVTDGSFTSTATATVRIVQRDDPPELTELLPALEAVEGVAFEFDLAPFFTDPEGADLGFEILDGELPASGGLALSQIGELTGTPAAGDVGGYAFIVSASDGSLNAEADLALSVLANQSVEVDAIPDQSGRVGQRIVFGVARYFADPEDLALDFRLSASGRDLSLTIDTRSGVITGFATEAGTYELSVTASDGFTPPVTAGVELVISE